MRTSLFFRNRSEQSPRWRQRSRQRLLALFALLFLLSMICLTFTPAQAASFNHTAATTNYDCQQFTYSSDGDPFPLCPGPLPTGGNCVWWAWEEWHLLGYDLPLNWGNAADWVVDAERFGLPIGTTPRVGSLAVFPVADGVWAFGSAGHVAFVTAVSSDGQNFNVTYQNYGDPTPMHIGTNYNVSLINEPRYQHSQLRFIYFPETINATKFAALPGVNGNSVPAAVSAANTQLTSSNGALTNGRVALGLPAGDYDQEFSADFANTGLTDLLLYNRQQGELDVLALSYPYSVQQLHNHPLSPTNTEQPQIPYRVSLHDDQTPVNGWGPNLEIHLGDFTNSGHTEILLYDRVSGKIQLLTLTPQFTIAKHVTFDGWGPGWEIYVGRFDGQRSDLLMYKRFAVPGPLPTPTPTPGSDNNNPPPGSDQNPTPTATATANPTAPPSPTATSTPTATPSPTASPSPTATSTPTATASPTASPSPTTTSTPATAPSPTATPSPSPVPQPSSTSTSTTTSTSQGGGPVTHPDGYATGLVQGTTPSAGGSEPVDPSGQSPSDWETSGLTAELFLVSFTDSFTLGATQDHSLWHNSWEIYVGRFASNLQDGIFLYDRNVGEGRVVDFTSSLQLAHFQFLHNLGGDWEVHVGDFAGQGQAQVLLYNASTGDAQMLLLKNDLTLANQISYSGWGTGQVLYVGHFGMPTLGIMLYDPVQFQSTFVAFDASLAVTHQYVAQGWGPDQQILLGSFLNLQLCQAQNSCAAGDNILVLNRSTGQIQQYVFSFGNQFNVFDSRSQGFIREGAPLEESVLPVDATLFTLFSSLDTTIRNEELY